MKKAILILISAILIGTLAACSQTVSADVLKSDKPRETPAVSQTDTAKLVEGNSTFAWDLYQILNKQEGNIFFSPYSISEALAMTYGGARGTTEQQMADALKFLMSQDLLHPAFNGLDQELAMRGQGAQGKDEKGFRLNVVNAIWGQKGYPFLSSYLDLLAQNYGAGLRVLDFAKSPEPSRQTINNWVSEQTEGKIQDLLPEGSITDLTRLVLTNAIYFNAAWLHQFKVENTADGTFSLPDGSTMSVPMMNQMDYFNYGKGPDYQMIELPYDGQQLSMVIILPDPSKFQTVEGNLSYAGLADMMVNLKSAEVRLAMPKFNFDSDFGLKEALSDLGMPVAFDPNNADFSGMDGSHNLFISDVIHKAYVSVDENGTEAAAATGVIVGTTAMPIDIVDLTIDHPFIFFIRDIQTGAILFIGRVMNPAS
jgi:serpin B